MNQQDRQTLARLIATNSIYYGRQLTADVLSMMTDDLSDLPLESVQFAFANYRRDSKNKSFPLPAQIRELVNPEASGRLESREAAARAVAAVSRFGRGRSEDARAEIGELAWQTVLIFGGWTQLCEILTAENRATITAQLRDLAEGVFEKAKAGNLGVPPALPPAENRNPRLSALISKSVRALPPSSRGGGPTDGQK